ncbi:MAG TPA: hypothetical protein VEZ17_02950, partial [Chitinophagaceae bacterium]|nr:hypothetical protein [Chitinophagaceae bacterium]
KYASIAPSSAHAQHMPSHIFTRLGLWDEAIKSNLESTASARCYAENAGIKGHWDEELHGMDYLVYAYLQRGENDLARKQLEYLNNIREVHPANFKVAYAFAAIPSRYFLENKMWKEAATFEIPRANLNWPDFPWQNAIARFAKLMGFVHTHDVTSAKAELAKLQAHCNTLKKQNDVYKANQVMIQIKTGEAWIMLEEGKPDHALQVMKIAAEMEDKTEKSPVTPGEVIPARELLGDMLLAVHKPLEAREAYRADLKKHPNRFNALYGAGLASEQVKDDEQASYYYTRLTATANSPVATRPELKRARSYLQRAR